MEGTTDSTPAPLRYVVLRHDGVADPHFDLMLEISPGAPLATWRLTEWPVKAATRLEKLPDHRQVYLEYEGPLSGDRGRVHRVEAGTYTSEPQWDDPHVIELTLSRPGKLFRRHLRLLRPPEHQWTLEPA